MTEVGAQVGTLLAMLVEDRVGLHFSDRDRDLLLHKVEDHAGDEGFESLLDFYYSLRYDDPDGSRFTALVDALVVGETFFFREAAGLERVVEHVAALVRVGRRPRIWSAACATGEEPLSLAILLAEAALVDAVDLVATDVSARHLERARRGEHGRRALRAAPEGRPPWLWPDGDRARVDAGLRARIDWRQVNLLDREAIAGLGTFDAILCRNVLIYFEERTVQRVAATLAGALAPDGILLVGASESLLRFGTVLECVERRGTFLYRRPGGP